MTIRERLDADLKDAMRARDQLRLDTVRAVKSAIKYKEVEAENKVLDDAGIIKVLQSEIKKRKDSVEEYRKAAREDLAGKEEKEIAILQVYMPQQLTAAEVEALVVEAIAESGAKGPKDMGGVMKAVQPKLGGRADNKVVSELVKAKLAALPA